MQFTVPQFIEREAKIVGPLTFRQFAYVGGAAGLGLILYLSDISRSLFFLITAIAGLLGIALAFVKINGKSLPIVLLNLLNYSFGPKIYFWGRKEIAPRLTTIKEKEVAKEDGSTPVLKIAGNSQLKKLSQQIETKN